MRGDLTAGFRRLSRGRLVGPGHEGRAGGLPTAGQFGRETTLTIAMLCEGSGMRVPGTGAPHVSYCPQCRQAVCVSENGIIAAHPVPIVRPNRDQEGTRHG